MFCKNVSQFSSKFGRHCRSLQKFVKMYRILSEALKVLEILVRLILQNNTNAFFRETFWELRNFSKVCGKLAQNIGQKQLYPLCFANGYIPVSEVRESHLATENNLAVSWKGHMRTSPVTGTCPLTGFDSTTTIVQSESTFAHNFDRTLSWPLH